MANLKIERSSHERSRCSSKSGTSTYLKHYYSFQHPTERRKALDWGNDSKWVFRRPRVPMKKSVLTTGVRILRQARILLYGTTLVLFVAGLAGASTVPFDYCASGVNGPGVGSLPTQTLAAFLADGCVSGEHQKGVTPDTDGYFDEAGGDTAAKVEQSILFAQGLTVTLDSVTANVVGTGDTGTWTTSQDAEYITVKAANGYALYYLGASGETSGTWTTAGLLNNGGQQPGVSGVELWSVAPSTVPEPKMTLLLELCPSVS